MDIQDSSKIYPRFIQELILSLSKIYPMDIQDSSKIYPRVDPEFIQDLSKS
jgi:hypothetical protein